MLILHTYGDISESGKKFNFVLTCSVMLMSHISSAHIIICCDSDGITKRYMCYINDMCVIDVDIHFEFQVHSFIQNIYLEEAMRDTYRIDMS